MKVERIVREELSFNPGEPVVVNRYGYEHIGRIIRVVENEDRTYVVIRTDNRYTNERYTAWRPISTYGKTWRRLYD